MSFSVSKINGKLFFRDYGGYETRNPSTFWCIEKADEIYKWKDFAEVIIHTGDFENSIHHYTYSKKGSCIKLVPDFNFHSWPQVGINDYTLFVKEIDDAGRNKHEVSKVGWIGNTNTHPARHHMLSIGESNKDLFDIFHMGWIATNSTLLNSTHYISTPELVKKYAILIDIEGNGYSGRLKHLLWSHRPLLLVDRPHKEFFFEFLNEWEHYIPVKRDLSDLVEKTRWCLDNYEGKSLQIAENAYQFSKLHLTREACYARWDHILGSGGGP
jgi:hypothetical protein